MWSHKEAFMKQWIRTSLIVVLFGTGLAAQQLPTATPESVGISTERLERMHKGMQGFIDRKEAGGVVTLVAREGKVVDVKAYGFQDVESKKPMRPDAIFRIASMSKPITSVAVMMLYEDGKLLLSDPVSKFIPSFKTQMVATKDASGAAK